MCFPDVSWNTDLPKTILTKGRKKNLLAKTLHLFDIF